MDVQSRPKRTTRDLLKQLIENNPTASKAELLALFKDAMQHGENRDLLDAVIQEFVSDNPETVRELLDSERSGRHDPPKVSKH